MSNPRIRISKTGGMWHAIQGDTVREAAEMIEKEQTDD